MIDDQIDQFIARNAVVVIPVELGENLVAGLVPVAAEQALNQLFELAARKQSVAIPVELMKQGFSEVLAIHDALTFDLARKRDYIDNAVEAGRPLDQRSARQLLINLHRALELVKTHPLIDGVGLLDITRTQNQGVQPGVREQ